MSRDSRMNAVCSGDARTQCEEACRPVEKMPRLLVMTAVLVLLAQSHANAQGAGTALQFDGVDDYVSVAHDNSLNLTGDYTIELFLKPEVTFDASATDYQGILDKGDYQMYLDPDDGKLKFVQPMAGGFSEEFNSNLDGDVWALAVYNGDLYVGGDFTTAGGMPAQNIARWDGTTWSTVGAGLDNGTVRALLVYDEELYAGGDFEYAGAVEVNGIAKWDGNTWNAVGPGFNGGPVRALAKYDNDLYAGGEFVDNGIITLDHIARWDGSEWSAVADGFDNAVYALLEYGGELYAGGSFTTTGAVPVEGMARWNGSSWSNVGGGVSGGEAAVHALAVYDGDLIVGGDFEMAGGISAPLMARWDGSIWSDMGTEEAGMFGVVRTLTVFDDKLSAAGSLFWQGMVRHVAMWNGSAWSSAGTHVSGDVNALAVYGDDLYAGGEFSSVAGTPGEHLAAFDGGVWYSVGATPAGTPGWVYVGAMAVHQGELYIGGEFRRIGANWPMQNIAKWDGIAWDSLADGADNTIDALTVYDSQLYAAGSFGSIGGMDAERIAMWDGSNWSALDSGCDRQVWALAEYDGQLYVGGQFTTAGGQPAEHIARWDGNSWSTVGSGTNQAVRAFAVYNGELYAGGWFTEAGGSPAYHIAKWDGSSWSAVGGGVDDDVLALAVYNNKLYAGGRFTTAGGEDASGIAQWDGVSWSPVGDGTNDAVRALAVYNNELYAGGDFYVAGLQVTPYIARWNGNTWSPAGAGMDEAVYTLAVWDYQQADSLFVGGRFHRAGDSTSPYFAQWTQPLRSIASSRTSWPPVQHHVAVSCDQSNLTMYVNGVLESTEATLTGEVDTTTTPLWIGRSSGPPVDGRTGEFLAGQIDEIRIADEWLSESDIRDTLNTKLTGEVSVTAYYRFDEGSGEVTTDSSPNNNAGSLVGPSWITSTAPLGDASVWTDDGSPLSLSSSYGDWLELVDLTGGPPFAALMRVDEAPNATDVGSGLFQVFDSHYFEAWIPEGSAPTYAAVYHYTDHPGVTEESVLALAFRSDADVPVWNDSTALLDTDNDTLRIDGETGGQYILGEAGHELVMAVAPPGAGTTQPLDESQTQHLVGSTVEICATPNPGYVFDHWESSIGDDPVPDPGCPTQAAVLMDADKVVTAQFVAGELIDSTWLGGTECPGFPGEECWNIPENWCPRIVPNNETGRQFNVGVPGPPTTITLDVSPTIDMLWIDEGVNVTVSDASGADVRTLSVVNGITSTGMFRATNASRLVLDAPTIEQAGGGELQADAAGILQINGAVVTEGIARTLGPDSAIELLGGAEFVNVTIESDRGKGGTLQAVAVPNAHSGVLSGTIVNDGGVRVAADLDITTLIPGTEGVNLAGTGVVVLANEDLAWFGGFGRMITNSAGHTIEGAGVLFGELINERAGEVDALVEANVDGKSLLISPPGLKTNDGVFRATAGGILDVWSNVVGNGDLEATEGGILQLDGVSVENHSLIACGGTIRMESVVATLSDGIDLPPGITPGQLGVLEISDSDVGCNDWLSVTCGSVWLSALSAVTVANGPVLLCPDTATDPLAVAELHIEDLISTLAATDMTISRDDVLGVEGILDIAGVVSLSGALSFANQVESNWSWGPLALLEMTGGQGLADDDPTGYVRLEIGGEDLGYDPDTHYGHPDGFVENFHLTELALGPGAHVTLVDLTDNGNRGGSTGYAEALYVKTLRFADDTGRLNLNGLHLYYETIDPPGSELAQITDCRLADSECDSDVDLQDFARFQTCFGADPIPAECARFDFDGDGAVDLYDYEVFEASASGPVEP